MSEYVEVVNEPAVTREGNIVYWFQEKTKTMPKKNMVVHIGLVWVVFYLFYIPEKKEREEA